MTRQKRVRYLGHAQRRGAGGWEFISGAASLLIKRQVLLLLGLRAGVAVEEMQGCVLSGGRGWGW